MMRPWWDLNKEAAPAFFLKRQSPTIAMIGACRPDLQGKFLSWHSLFTVQPVLMFLQLLQKDSDFLRSEQGCILSYI